MNGSTIGTLGNFSAPTGKAKSKKTFNISAIVAAALRNSEVLQYSAYLPQEKRKILYVDTEQSFYHCHKVLKRIMRLAGYNIEQNSNDFLFIVLREHTPERRREIIGETLRRVKGIGLVIIDGIRDLMYDINSPSESAEIINLLMRWSSEYNLHIHTVLHLNKGDDNTRGHIGTELNNKAETVLQVTKSTQDANINEIKKIKLADYLQSLGYTPVKQQGRSLWYKSPLRNETDASFKVNTELNQWYDFGIGKGGNIIALVAELYHSDNVAYLLERIAERTPYIRPATFSFGEQRTSNHSFEEIKVGELSSPALIDYSPRSTTDGLLRIIPPCRFCEITINGLP